MRKRLGALFGAALVLAGTVVSALTRSGATQCCPSCPFCP